MATIFVVLLSGAQADSLSADEKACVKNALEGAADTTTIGELKKQCRIETVQSGVVEERLEIDKENTLEPFTIMSHRRNYLLPVTYNSKGYNVEDFQLATGDANAEPQDIEAQFQISIKTPLGVNLFNKDIDLYGAYTVRSFWQLYNRDASSPFRETNHEPEIWLQTYPGWKLGEFRASVFGLGFVHQSNGKSEPLSRSWNRIFATTVFERGNLALAFKPWYRIPEDDEDDNNPDITDYMGHYELYAAYKHNEHVFSIMSRNNLESGFERGAIEAGWSFPLGGWPYLKGYVQYFHGYGQSLIDYDNKVNQIGVGIMINDLL